MDHIMADLVRQYPKSYPARFAISLKPPGY